MTKKLILPPDNVLADPHYVQLLAITAWCIKRGTKYVSRRTLVDLIADVFRDVEVTIQHADGRPYPIPDIDETFEPAGYVDTLEAGHDFEFNRGFMISAIELPERPATPRAVEKLRLIDAAVRAGGPPLWRNQKK